MQTMKKGGKVGKVIFSLSKKKMPVYLILSFLLERGGLPLTAEIHQNYRFTSTAQYQ